MKSAGKARSNGLYRHIRTSKEIIRNLLNDYFNCSHNGKGSSILKKIYFIQNLPHSHFERLRFALCP